MKFRVLPLELPLKKPFQISHLRMEKAKNLLVILEEGPFVGYGEAVPMPFYGEDAPRAASEINQVLGQLEGLGTMDLPWLQAWLKELGRKGLLACSLAALEMALLDFLAKRRGQALWELLEVPPPGRRASFRTLSLSEEAESHELLDAKAKGPVKLKLGGVRDDEFLDLLAQNPRTNFALDMNCGWSFDRLERESARLRRANLLFIEDPCPAEELARHKDRLKEILAVPWFADEHFHPGRSETHKNAGGINFKFSKLGGYLNSVTEIQTARARGQKTLNGCFLQSSLSVAFAFHLAGIFDHLDLDGASFLAWDPFANLRFELGEIWLEGNQPGIGVQHVA